MKKLTALVLALVLSFSVMPGAMAASPWTEAEDYQSLTEQKLTFGLKNAFFGWSEIFDRVDQYNYEDKSPFTGFFEGIYYAVIYTIGGVLHVATFPLPIDVPLPNNGVQLG